jgi:hypothetical protein
MCLEPSVGCVGGRVFMAKARLKLVTPATVLLAPRRNDQISHLRMRLRRSKAMPMNFWWQLTKADIDRHQCS